MAVYGMGTLLVAEDGGVFNFSDQPFRGSLGRSSAPSLVVSVASVHVS